MPSADKQGMNDQVLSRYLLGSLPTEEAERLDELSIADDEFALRLDAVENNLVDAYARGDLSGDELEQFQKFYLSSPRRREKVEFARTFLRFAEKTASAVAGATTQPAIPSAQPADQTSHSRSPWRRLTIPKLGLQWGFAVAAMVLLFAGRYLFIENLRLRQQATEVRNQQIALNQRTQDLESQLREQRSANTGLQKELEGLRASLPESHTLKTIAVLLLAPMRGAGQIPTVSVPPGTEQVRIHLQLEPNDFRLYQVALKAPSTNRILWNATKLHPSSQGQNKVVSANVPARLLKQQNYVMELTGVPTQGNAELLTSYAFKVVLE
jgi:anti-sigma factor RsiW